MAMAAFTCTRRCFSSSFKRSQTHTSCSSKLGNSRSLSSVPASLVFRDASPAWREHIISVSNSSTKVSDDREDCARHSQSHEHAALSALRSAAIPLSDRRKTVLPDNVNAVAQICLGLVGSKKPVIAPETQGELTKALVALFHDAHDSKILPQLLDSTPAWMVPKGGTAPPFTSIQINYNYSSVRHVVGNNVGPSFIRGLGEYDGGELIVEDEDGHGTTKKDVKSEWVCFDGRVPHYTAEFQGERYSVIYFVQSSFSRVSRTDWEELIRMGFPLQSLPQPPLASLADARVEASRISSESNLDVLLVRGAGAFADDNSASRRGAPALWLASVRRGIETLLNHPGCAPVVVEGWMQTSMGKPANSVLVAVPREHGERAARLLRSAASVEPFSL